MHVSALRISSDIPLRFFFNFPCNAVQSMFWRFLRYIFQVSLYKFSFFFLKVFWIIDNLFKLDFWVSLQRGFPKSLGSPSKISSWVSHTQEFLNGFLKKIFTNSFEHFHWGFPKKSKNLTKIWKIFQNYFRNFSEKDVFKSSARYSFIQKYWKSLCNFAKFFLQNIFQTLIQKFFDEFGNFVMDSSRNSSMNSFMDYSKKIL